MLQVEPACHEERLEAFISHLDVVGRRSGSPIVGMSSLTVLIFAEQYGSSTAGPWFAL